MRCRSGSRAAAEDLEDLSGDSEICRFISPSTIFALLTSASARRLIHRLQILKMRMSPRAVSSAQSFVNKSQIFSTVGRPDPVSNIRMVRYHVDPKQSLRRCQLEARRLRATAKWHDFWTKHNADYNSKLENLKAKYADCDEIPSAEMSNFYAMHLANTRANHKEFNSWWIRENFYLLFAGARCWVLEKVQSGGQPGFFGGH